jgi:uncharacterized protein (DUF2267 family)
MDELVNVVQEKTGLPEDKAKQAVNVVIDFLKDRLPGPMAKQVDAALKNEAAMDQAADMLGKGAEKLGGMLGGKGKG